jgi:serine/threonine protein kinase
VKSRIVQSQGVILTKSLDIENGRHRHFTPGEPLPFDILGRLGNGGYGQVDRIVSKISLRQYALKRIRRRAAFGNDSKVAMKQFMSEIHIIKSLEHRHIVQYIGSYTDKAFLGLVMAPVADTDLAAFMGQTCMYIQAITTTSDESAVLRLRNQALASEMCATLRTYFGCLAAALVYLHDRSIRHKDIKPQNILVHKGNVLLTDFGLSKDFTDDGGGTTSGITPASPRYSPPEVAMYEARNTSADIWSLGCVFLEMLAALHGYNTDWIKRYFAGVHTQATHFHANPDATSQLLQEWATAWTMLDQMPLLWTKEMLHMKRQSRPTAARVFELVISIGESNQSSTTFCGVCCILDDKSDSNDSLLDDLTILAEPRSARVRADLRRTSLEHSHSAVAAIPVLQGGSSNTKSDETDRVRQDLALTSANQPVQSASTGENIQLDQSTSPEPALGEAIGRAKTHDLSVEGAEANRSAVIGVIGHDHEHQRARSMMIEVSAPVDNPVSILEEKQPVEDSVYVQGEEPPVVGHTVSLSPSSSEYSIDSTKRPAISSHGRSEVFDKGASAKDMTMNVAETLSSSDMSLFFRRPLSTRSLALKDIRAQGGGGSSTHIAELPTDSELFPNSSKPNSDDYDDTLPILSDFMDRKPGTFGAPPTYTEYKEGPQSFVIEAYDEPMTKFTKKKAKNSQIDMSNISSSVDGPAAQRSSSTGSRSSSRTSKTKFRQDSGSRSSPAPGQRGVRRYFADLKKRFASKWFGVRSVPGGTDPQQST